MKNRKVKRRIKLKPKFFLNCLIIIIIIIIIKNKDSLSMLLNNINKVKVPEYYSTIDNNNNSIPDCEDIVIKARQEVKNKTKYEDNYYIDGYPPDDEGVCTDVIWRAFESINVNLKDNIDKDIMENTDNYYWVDTIDPNIDFRRVPNLYVYLENNAESLDCELIPENPDNLSTWQRGDIVVFLKPFQHIAIISDRRTRDGVPYIIHNTPPHAIENSSLEKWKDNIAGHYRWKY
ncbi:MAG: DUF1287 domain-containing protein [Clostridiaceae bacterium]